MKKTLLYLLPVYMVASLGACDKSVDGATDTNTLPAIFPDYIGVTVPYDIAPLNFCVDDTLASLFDVVISGKNGDAIHCQGSEAIDIDIDDWHNLLALNKGDSLSVSVSVLHGDGWKRHKPFGIYVSADSVDYGLAYRLVAPGYEKYSNMGIYERCLRDFSEKPVFENTQVRGCVNCHSFNHCDPSSMSMHVRGEHGATLIKQPERPLTAFNTTTDATISSCVYPYWHPEGRFIAYSTNVTRQSVNIDHAKLLEVFDLASDIQIYDTHTNKLISPAVLNDTAVWETFPAFSPDGKYLYYSAAKAVPMPDSVNVIRYDICRVAFDAVSGSVVGKPDTLVCASAQGRSAVMARPSFDGRFLVYTMCDYGTFPIWHDEADLYMLDLATGESKALDVLNSELTESYHNFSSNSRWLVFGSRRLDGRHTRAYIAHVDANGNVAKPFLLPQKSPREFYDELYRSYNIPEFIIRPIGLDPNNVASVIVSPERKSFER